MNKINLVQLIDKLAIAGEIWPGRHNACRHLACMSPYDRQKTTPKFRFPDEAHFSGVCMLKLHAQVRASEASRKLL